MVNDPAFRERPVRSLPVHHGPKSPPAWLRDLHPRTRGAVLVIPNGHATDRESVRRGMAGLELRPGGQAQAFPVRLAPRLLVLDGVKYLEAEERAQSMPSLFDLADDAA